MDNLNLIDKNLMSNSTQETVSFSNFLDDISDEVEASQNIEETLSNPSISENTNNSNKIEETCTALVELKPRGLLVAQTMFKKSIRISIKSFLISLSLGFLNLFF